MFAWIAENAVTIIAVSVILISVGFAVFSLLKGKKNKTGGCTGNCASCGMCCGGGKDKKAAR